MLQYEGYYLEEPLEIYDGRCQIKSSYRINAFLFLKNGKVKKTSKHEYLKDLKDFTSTDFKGICEVLDYKYEGKNITIKTQFGKGYKIIFDSENVAKINSTGAKLVFIPWEKIERLNEKQIEKADIINEYYGPFYHKKYKVYYE